MATVAAPAHFRSTVRERHTRRAVYLAAVLVIVVVVLTAGEHWLADWLRGAGVGVVGDQPAYLSQAQALLKGTVHTYGVYRQDLARHYFSAFPPHTKMSSAVFESFRGPRGVVSPFEPGMALLIAPFMAIGGQGGAFIGLFAVEAAGLTLVHRRATSLCRLGWRAQVFLAVAMVSPAVAVAATQLYPDLISGIALAAAAVELVRWEREPRPGPGSVAILAISAGVLPWFQVKNAAPATVMLGALVFVAWRRRTWRPAITVIALVALCWLLLASYNLAYFGHLSGYPEPGLGFDHAGLVRVAALLFDRDQGLFVQLPTAMLGVIGAWLAARRAPVSIAAAVLAVATIIVLNGTYTGSPYGGVTLAGRFEWTAMPVCVAVGAFALERWQDEERALLRGAVVLVACWGYQARSLIDHDHTILFFTQLTGWDPASYPGWWSALNGRLAEYVVSPRLFGLPGLGSLLVVLVALAVVWLPSVRLSSMWLRGAVSPQRWIGMAWAAGLVAVVAVVFAVDPGNALPAGPLIYSGADIGSPLMATSAAVAGPVITIEGTTAGTYQVMVTYDLTGSKPASLFVYCRRTLTGPSAIRTRRQSLPAAAGTARVTIACPVAGSVATRLTTPPGSQLSVARLALSKTAAA
jgi:hypothetical protein